MLPKPIPHPNIAPKPNPCLQAAMLSAPHKHTIAYITLLALVSPTTALADQTNEPDWVTVRPAPDDLSGHIILAPKLAYSLPLGSAEKRFGQRAYTASGVSFGGDISYGISRYIAIHGRFEYGTYAENNKCPADGTCNASTIAFGIGVDYHILNGAGFDPWVRVGTGYRTIQYSLRWDGYDERRSYSGFDWLHIAIGGEWYPTTIFGFGPYVALDVGKYGTRPDKSPPLTSMEQGSAFHTFFTLGLRAVLDPMR